MSAEDEIHAGYEKEFEQKVSEHPRPDLQLPAGWHAAAQEAVIDFQTCEWTVATPEEAIWFQYGFWYGAIWRQKLSSQPLDAKPV